jgi:hypothetical protein
VAPAGTVRVRVEVAGAAPFEAELATAGPAPGQRYYAGFVEGAPAPTQLAVVALDGAGTELARVSPPTTPA